MKVLYVYDGKMRSHGLDLVARQQLQALSDAGMETLFISRGHVDLPHISNRRVRFNPAKLFSWRPAKVYYGANRRYIDWIAARQLRKQAFDVVVTWTHCAESLVREAGPRNIPVVINSSSAAAFGLEQSGIETPWPMVSPARIRKEYGGATLVMPPSANAARRYVSDGLPAEILRPMERGFDSSRFHPPAERPDTFRALFCGRVCERKGARQVVDAWRQAGLAHGELLFLGNVDKELEGWAAEVAAESPGIRFLGFRDDVPELMRGCSVQILLSRNESFGKSLVEGAACGLVTIGTRDIGFPIINDLNGFTVDRDDTRATADLLKRLHDDPGGLARLSDQSINYVNENLTWAKFHQRFIAAVREATRRPA